MDQVVYGLNNLEQCEVYIKTKLMQDVNNPERLTND